MGLVGRLNALDERAGVRGPVGSRRWEARLRLWWLAIAVAYGGALVTVALALVSDGSASGAVAIALLPGAFYSGFLYNERLRVLGRRPRLLEVPASWPELLPAVPPGEASSSKAAPDGYVTSH